MRDFPPHSRSSMFPSAYHRAFLAPRTFHILAPPIFPDFRSLLGQAKAAQWQREKEAAEKKAEKERKAPATRAMLRAPLTSGTRLSRLSVSQLLHARSMRVRHTQKIIVAISYVIYHINIS